MPGELADHLIDSQAVVLPHVVQEPQGVVLRTGDGGRARAGEAQATSHGRPLQSLGFSLLISKTGIVRAGAQGGGDNSSR